MKIDHKTNVINLGATTLGTIPGFGGYQPKAGEVGAADTITKALSNTIGLLTVVAGLFFAVNFILGALQWITSSGQPEKVQKAQNKMTHAAIGMIAVVASYGIAYIVGQILGIEILNPAEYINKWWG